MKNKNIKSATNFEELLDFKYGMIGINERTNFEKKAKQFVEREVLKNDVKIKLAT
jgi:hypothetical protein